MRALRGARIAVAGGGVLGLSVGLELARRGAQVTIYDPQARVRSASGVAAGMLAPAFEAALDAASESHWPLLRAARDLWPAFVESIAPKAVALDRSGAMFLAGAHDLAAMETLQRRLTGLGAASAMLGAEAARALQPDLAGHLAGALFTPEDWRVDPRKALPALAQAFRRAGGVFQRRALSAKGSIPLCDGVRVAADAVVIAAGSDSSGLMALAPELGRLTPIKGQLLHFEAGPLEGPVLRGRGGYVSPQPGGAVVGATMELGRADRRTDDLTLQRLRDEAAHWLPHLASAPARGAAGVRAASPDSLPLVGPSARSKVILATGARRNGWLLAPLAARTVAAHLAGEEIDPLAAALDPRRFN